MKNNFVVMPEQFGDHPHDMAIGPCACGATHSITDWPEHVQQVILALPAPQPGGGGEAAATNFKGGDELCAPTDTPSPVIAQTVCNTGASNAEESTSNPSLHPPTPPICTACQAEFWWDDGTCRFEPSCQCFRPTPPIALPVRAEAGTPRTDAAEHGPGRGGFAGHVSADFARTLEREAAALSRELEEVRRHIFLASGYHARTEREIEIEAALNDTPGQQLDSADHAIKELLELVDAGRSRYFAERDAKETLRAELEEAKAEARWILWNVHKIEFTGSKCFLTDVQSREWIGNGEDYPQAFADAVKQARTHHTKTTE